MGSTDLNAPAQASCRWDPAGLRSNPSWHKLVVCSGNNQTLGASALCWLLRSFGKSPQNSGCGLQTRGDSSPFPVVRVFAWWWGWGSRVPERGRGTWRYDSRGPPRKPAEPPPTRQWQGLGLFWTSQYMVTLTPHATVNCLSSCILHWV